jgi:hypothetical protein
MAGDIFTSLSEDLCSSGDRTVIWFQDPRSRERMVYGHIWRSCFSDFICRTGASRNTHTFIYIARVTSSYGITRVRCSREAGRIESDRKTMH